MEWSDRGSQVCGVLGGENLMIKPYYQDKYCTIYHGDCLEVMPQLKLVDLIFADPPFNTKGGMGIYNREYEGEAKYNNLSKEEYGVFCSQWFQLARKNCKRLVITPGAKNTHKYPEPLQITIISQPSKCSFNPFGGYNCWEPLFVYDRPVVKLPRDVMVFDALNLQGGPQTNHPCPDNPKMIKWILLTWSNKNEIILDPFLGSGTTTWAAKQLNRKAIGIEIEEKYCEIAVRRLAQEPFDWNEK